MAQVNSLNAAHVGRQRLQANSLAVTVGTGLTTLLDMDVSLISRIALQLKNTGGTAFNAFQLQGNMDSAGDAFVVLVSAATHFTTPTGIIVDASGDLTVLAGSNATGWVIIDVLGLRRLRAQASVAAGSTTANAVAGGS